MKAEDLDGPRAANRNIGKAVTNRNKYFLLEQERSNQVVGGGCFDRREEGGGKQHELQPGVESSQSYNTFVNSSSNNHLRLRMNRVDGFNSAMEASPKRSGDKLGLDERACIPTTEVFDALETLSSTLIFKSANKAERLALASRLRRWVVKDGMYLIREGDSDTSDTAIFMVASGKATISHNRILSNGTVEEADVRDIKYPNYFGEGRVLGGNPAYASVRAKGELVVYYITRGDLEELLSLSTRVLMIRDMHLRKYQKEHLNDLFSVIRKNPSGMACLARFANEKLMGGEVAFAIDVEAYKKFEGDSSKRKEMAERIVDRYISKNCATADGGSGVIYTSESQRKALAAAMRNLWGSETHFDENLAKREDKIDVYKTSLIGGEWKKIVSGFLQDDTSLQDGGRPGSDDVGGDRGKSAPNGKQNENETDAERKEGLFSEDLASDSSDRYAFGLELGRERNGDAEKIEEEAKRVLSLNLFDEILNQNAIPTVRQNIVPKFIQSSYYEDVLKELTLDETEANAASNDVPPSATAVNEVDVPEGRERTLTDSLEAVKHDPEAMEEKIAEAVAVAAAAARAEGKQKSGSAGGKETDRAGGYADEGGAVCGGFVEETLQSTRRNDLDGVFFSDEPLVITNFRQERIFASRILNAGLATRKKARGLCVTM